MKFSYRDTAIVLSPIIASNIVQLIFPMTKKTTRVTIQPPSYVFGIVWTIIYLLYGFYATAILNEPHKNIIMLLWLTNLIINLSWSPIVFTYDKYITGLYIEFVLVGLILAKICITENSLTRLFLVPYVTWLGVAIILTVETIRKRSGCIAGRKVEFKV